MEALYNLNKRYSIEEGDVITVQNNGNHFVYAFNRFYSLGEWVQIGDKIDITLDSMNDIGAINGKWFAANKIPYPSATMIQVKDAGNGKSAGYFYFNKAWQKRIQGGEAGTIQLTAKEIIILNESAIATEAISSGGGSIVTD